MFLYRSIGRPILTNLLIAALALTLSAPLRADAPIQAGAIGIPDFGGNTGWLNSAPLTVADLRGKTVLVDFFDYSCLNCLRTLPYLKDWYARYHQYGFELIGVQTPSFTFSGDRQNVEDAVKRLGITWPIVLDANDAIWKRYGNESWPHEYLFAPNGQLVESFPGEGGYPDTERKIQLVLKVAQPNLDLPPVMALLPQDSYDKPGAVCYPVTPEVVIEQASINDRHANTVEKDGAVYLSGSWHKTAEAVVSGAAGAAFDLVYHAIQLDVVMRPMNGPVRATVTLDGKPVPASAAGKDLRYDADGTAYVTVDASRNYDIIGTGATWAKHLQLRITPQAAGLAIYDVAFESCEVPRH